MDEREAEWVVVEEGDVLRSTTDDEFELLDADENSAKQTSNAITRSSSNERETLPSCGLASARAGTQTALDWPRRCAPRAPLGLALWTGFDGAGQFVPPDGDCWCEFLTGQTCVYCESKEESNPA